MINIIDNNTFLEKWKNKLLNTYSILIIFINKKYIININFYIILEIKCKNKF